MTKFFLLDVIVDELDAIAGGKGKSFSALSFDDLLNGHLIPKLVKQFCTKGMDNRNKSGP